MVLFTENILTFCNDTPVGIMAEWCSTIHESPPMVPTTLLLHDSRYFNILGSGHRLVLRQTSGSL